MTVILVFFVAHWYLSLFFQTFFLHRYAAHKAFTMNKFTEKVFFYSNLDLSGIKLLKSIWIWCNAQDAPCLCRYGG